MASALKMPMKMVIENKTAEESGHIINKIEATGNIFAGYDCKKGKNISIFICL